MMKEGSSDNYIKSIKLTFKYLTNYFGKEKNISEIDRADAGKFIASLRKTAPDGYRVYFRNLKAAFNVAVDWEYIAINQFTKVKLPKKQKEAPAYITPKEFDLILDKMKNKTLKAIVHYAFFTGSRRNEILNLRWKHLDLSKKTITIGDKDFKTKTGKQRIIPMGKYLHDELLKWEKSRKKKDLKPDSLVFGKTGEFSYHEDVPTKAFKRACRDAGIDDRIHFHSLRHSFASYLVQNKVNLYNIQKLLGHCSITTTEIYAHLDIDSLKESVKAFDSIKK